MDKLREYVDSVYKKTLDERLSNRRGMFGSTPLHEAVRGGHEDVLQFLLMQGLGGVVNCRSSSSYTPLHQAASAGHLKCVQVLLKHDADFSLQDDFGKTPKQAAELSSNSAIVKLLHSEGVCNPCLFATDLVALSCTTREGYSKLRTFFGAFLLLVNGGHALPSQR